MSIRFATLLCLLATICAGHAYPTNQDQALEKIWELNWKQEPGRHELESINAVYNLGNDEQLLVGSQAEKFMQLTQGDSDWGDIALLTMAFSGPMAGSFVTYSHQPIGYVEDDDWSSLDADGILESLRIAQAESNERRAAAGYATLEVVGWADEPTYNRDADAAYWAVELKDSEGGTTINATALKLSRDGFTNITWAGTADQFAGASEVLVASSDSYQFQPGAQYADYRSGDALAGIGLAALATGIVTGKGWSKTAGAGLIALLLAFAKKLWFLLLLPLVWIGKLFKRPRAKSASEG